MRVFGEASDRGARLDHRSEKDSAVGGREGSHDRNGGGCRAQERSPVDKKLHRSYILAKEKKKTREKESHEEETHS